MGQLTRSTSIAALHFEAAAHQARKDHAFLFESATAHHVCTKPTQLAAAIRASFAGGTTESLSNANAAKHIDARVTVDAVKSSPSNNGGDGPTTIQLKISASKQRLVPAKHQAGGKFHFALQFKNLTNKLTASHRSSAIPGTTLPAALGVCGTTIPVISGTALETAIGTSFPATTETASPAAAGTEPPAAAGMASPVTSEIGLPLAVGGPQMSETPPVSMRVASKQAGSSGALLKQLKKTTKATSLSSSRLLRDTDTPALSPPTETVSRKHSFFGSGLPVFKFNSVDTIIPKWTPSASSAHQMTVLKEKAESFPVLPSLTLDGDDSTASPLPIKGILKPYKGSKQSVRFGFSYNRPCCHDDFLSERVQRQEVPDRKPRVSFGKDHLDVTVYHYRQVEFDENSLPPLSPSFPVLSPFALSRLVRKGRAVYPKNHHGEATRNNTLVMPAVQTLALTTTVTLHSTATNDSIATMPHLPKSSNYSSTSGCSVSTVDDVKTEVSDAQISLSILDGRPEKEDDDDTETLFIADENITVPPPLAGKPSPALRTVMTQSSATSTTISARHDCEEYREKLSIPLPSFESQSGNDSDLSVNDLQRSFKTKKSFSYSPGQMQSKTSSPPTSFSARGIPTGRQFYQAFRGRAGKDGLQKKGGDPSTCMLLYSSHQMM